MLPAGRVGDCFGPEVWLATEAAPNGGTVTGVSWALLLPSAAILTALAVLATQLRRMDRELVELRNTLRKTTATAVSSDELLRSTARLAQHAGRQQQNWQNRRSAPRRSRAAARRSGHR